MAFSSALESRRLKTVGHNAILVQHMAIYFYSTKAAYGEFSNFSAHPFSLDGKTWPTSEHFFQAQKFEDAAYCEQIRLANSPMIAARLGRSRAHPLRADWESIKDDVMRRAIRAKCAAHPKVGALLLSTGEQELVEQTTGDYYWGCGKNGSGQNKLGLILMEVRAELLGENR